MARLDYDYECNGCGSGTSCNFTIKKDNVEVDSGSFQATTPCSQQTKDAQVLALYAYTSADVVYINGKVLKSSSSSSWTMYVVAAAIAGYLILREK